MCQDSIKHAAESSRTHHGNLERCSTQLRPPSFRLILNCVNRIHEPMAGHAYLAITLCI